jgi:hypothetical protein
LINASSRLLSNAEDVEAGSVAVVDAAMDQPEVAEANSVEDVAKVAAAVELAVDVVTALQELLVDLLEEALPPSTPATRVHSQAWGHKVSSQELKSLQMIF